VFLPKSAPWCTTSSSASWAKAPKLRHDEFGAAGKSHEPTSFIPLCAPKNALRTVPICLTCHTYSGHFVTLSQPPPAPKMPALLATPCP
jgi:hypothetical protein